MITGDWGCGKTYYIKKSLLAKISLLNSYTKDKKDQILKYEPLYISLYGITDISDVLQKIQLELNPWMKSKPWQFFKSGANKIASFFNVAISNSEEKNFLSIFDIKKNKVLFLDDLERIDKSLSLSSILGQINHFTEQENLKVIIVCNSSKTEEIFNEVNEKTIRFSCKYAAIFSEVYDSILPDYPAPYNVFLKDRKQIVLEIFQNADYKNLRTLRFILDIFQKVFKQVNQSGYSDEILKRFLVFTTIYSIEYKIGVQSKDLDSLINVGPYSLINFDFTKLFSDKQTDLKEEEKSYGKLFSEKYSTILESYHYCQELADYIHNGYLNEDKLTTVIQDIIDEFKKKEGTDEDKLIKNIRDWRNINDADLDPLLDNILRKIDEGKFSLIAYPVIFAEFLQIEFYKVNGFEVSNEIIERFKNGIDKSKETHIYFEGFRFRIASWSDRDTTPAKAKYYEISKYVNAANDDSIIKVNHSIAESILNKIEICNSKDLQDMIADPKHLNSPIFERIDVEILFDLLKKADSKTIDAFNAGIYWRYGDCDFDSESVFQQEIEFFEKLHELVVKHINGIERIKISTVHFIDLEKNLKRFIKTS